MYGAGDVRVEDVPDPRILQPTDALVRVTRSCICGSDLWPYKQMPESGQGTRMGHEFIGVVEDAGADVTAVAKGDVVVAPFVWSDGTCAFCAEGLHTSCLNGGFWGTPDVDGGQGEAVRVPQADGTLVKLPVPEDDALMPSLLTLSDVFATGHHAAVSARVSPGSPSQKPPCSQEVVSPSRQNWQVPSEKANGAMTRSPLATVVTSEPVSSTTPMNSWPIRAGPSAGSIEW